MKNIFSSIGAILVVLCVQGPLVVNAATPGTSLYNLQGKWTDEEGRSRSLTSLKGRPVIAAMIYASCEGTCPLIVENMKKLEAQLSKRSKVKPTFALFSFDTVKDKPTQLKEFAQEHGLDLGHWALFQGDSKSVRELAAALGVRYKKDRQGNFTHSNIISLLDADGVLRYQQAGLNRDFKEFIEKFLAELPEDKGR